MKLKMLKPKKNVVIIIAVILAILIIAGLGTYFYFRSQTQETVAEPASEDEFMQAEEDEMITVEINEEDENSLENEIDENGNVISKTIKNSNSNTNNQNSSSSLPYYIKINYGANVVTIYGKDSEGNYTVPVKAMVCSTGKDTPTSGKYKIPGRKQRWGALFGNVYGQYATDIVGNILFHSVPYTRKGDPTSLTYWAYDKLGTKASAGCIRLTVQDAQWIYNNIAKGTIVEFYSDSNPGPLGKPSAKKISGYPDYLRNWDPTDPDTNNPWKTYKEATDTQPTTTTNTETQGTTTNPTTNTETQGTTTSPKTDEGAEGATTNPKTEEETEGSTTSQKTDEETQSTTTTNTTDTVTENTTNTPKTDTVTD